jgi:O-antigen biosynthesis protein
VLAVDYPRFEVIVVDNGPSSSATADLVQTKYADVAAVRYTVEEVAGVARARNRGLAEARGQIVAYTDDDVLVDRNWLRALVRAFRTNPGVACVSGAILPAELETRAQLLVQQGGGFGKSYEPELFDLGEHAPADPLYPYAAGRFGCGANMSFDAATLRRLGGYDEALGPGTPTRAGEDLDISLRVLFAGCRLVHEPAALVWHHHNRSYPAVRRQMFAYGAGLGAVMTKWMMSSVGTFLDMASRVPRGVAHLLSPSSSKNASKSRSYPWSFTVRELAGMLTGPFVYRRSLRHHRATASRS